MTYKLRTSEDLPSIELAIHAARAKLQATHTAAPLEAEMLLAYVIAKPRSFLRTWPQTLLTSSQWEQYHQLTTRRLKGEPIAYLIGEREFWSMKLTVTPATLIPRPETERLVELALAKIPPHANWQIADLGTGSGAIALAIAKERPGCQISACDKSQQALNIAISNAHRHNIKNIQWLHSHWFEGLGAQQFDVVVANPPYIAVDDPHLSQGDLRFEPISALTSGQQGLDDIIEIVTQSRKYIKAGGWLLIEHGFNQGEQVASLLTANHFEAVECVSDYGARERVTLGSLSKP